MLADGVRGWVALAAAVWRAGISQPGRGERG